MALPTGSPVFEADGIVVDENAGATNQLPFSSASWVKIKCADASAVSLNAQVEFNGGLRQNFTLAAGESEEFASRGRGGDITGFYGEGDGGSATFTLLVRAIGG
jgi:hypothetical protein